MTIVKSGTSLVTFLSQVMEVSRFKKHSQSEIFFGRASRARAQGVPYLHEKI